MRYPKYTPGQRYVMDSVGVIWLLVPEYDGGMATTADATSIYSIGITVLQSERGPLVPVPAVLTPELHLGDPLPKTAQGLKNLIKEALGEDRQDVEKVAREARQRWWEAITGQHLPVSDLPDHGSQRDGV